MTLHEFFRQSSYDGLGDRLKAAESYGQTLDESAYRERLDFEVDVILQMGFPGYFLIVADFIQWAKDSAIPVGPGRGSGAGSIVAWALKITDLDPIEPAPDPRPGPTGMAWSLTPLNKVSND